MPKKRKSKAASNAQKRIKTDKYDTQYLLTNPKSCLATANLASLLNAQTWDLLSTEEQQLCLSLLPEIDKTKLQDDTYAVKPTFFTHNIFLQQAFRSFQTNLLEGSLMPGHQKKLAQASVDRAAGKADAYKEEQFEHYWGEKSGL